MPMKIPDNAVIVRDRRLTLVCIYNLLKPLVEKAKTAIKKTVTDKGAKFVQSDFAQGRVSGGQAREVGTFTYTWIDPKKLYALVQSEKITLAQFFSVITVGKDKLTEFLSGVEIDAITRSEELSTESAASGLSLTAELKPGVAIDLSAIEAAILREIESCASLSTPA